MHYRRNEEIVFTETDGRKSLYHPETGQFFSLNPVGSMIWSQLSDWKTTKQLLPIIVGAFDVEPWQASTDINKFVKHLLENDLIVTENGQTEWV